MQFYESTSDLSLDAGGVAPFRGESGDFEQGIEDGRGEPAGDQGAGGRCMLDVR